jgi:hypothetical protein
MRNCRSRRERSTGRPWFGLLALLALLAACASGSATLNSDLIEARFGSFGVEVISEDERRRVSSLYSLTNDVRVTRTWAVVEYLGRPGAAIAREHAEIVAGGSIGKTFGDAGWSIRKQNLYVGELELPPAYSEIGEHMQVDLPANVVVHQYLFIVSRDDRSYNYARITEVHHPAFLSADEIERQYGEVVFDDSNRDSIHDFLGPPSTK